jgi:hypothetical protein
VCGVHWRRARSSGGEDHGRSGGEGSGGSTRSRRSQGVRGVLSREEDWLLRSSAVEMSPGGAEARWRGRRGGERGRGGGAAEHGH